MSDATLFVVATPIGNLEDISFRAVRILGEVGALACEDTRRSRIIFDRYDIARPRTIFSCHEHNEEQASRRILGLLATGVSVALVTNAGYPSISDPGYRVVAAAIDGGFDVDVIPGPSAVVQAVVLSGLPSSSFTFLGFPPRKPGPLRRLLGEHQASSHTLVFYESPHRIVRLLEAVLETLGDRRGVVCIELTKMFEQVKRGFVSGLVEELSGQTIKGEVTLVVAGDHPKFRRGSA